MISKLRLISGFILFAFVLGHFTSHALGLVSISLMNEATFYTISPWRTFPGTALITVSLGIHATLAVWALYCRQSLRMKSWEFFQLISGFAIPILLSAHVLSTRGGYEAFGLEEGYALQLYAQWITSPMRGVMTVSALLMVWIHSCIGWHFWLRYKSWYNKNLPAIFAAAILIPTLAIAGIVSAGFKVLKLSSSERWVSGVLKGVKKQGDAYDAFISYYEELIVLSLIFMVLAVIVINIVRWIWKYRSHNIKLEYRSLELDQRMELKLPKGQSVLQHLRNNKIRHASVCGGRGRCSTCRIRVEGDPDRLPPKTPEEQKILNRIGAEENIRLACQLSLESDLSVIALLRPDISSTEALNQVRQKTGEEQEVAILFADIRGFTKLSESQLPYDTAFLLNRFFAAMGKAIEGSGGHLDKFIGDGVMAIFGIDKSIEEGCREAIMAAHSMSAELEKLNASLQKDIGQILKIGIGIHSGQAIIGNMGYNKAIGLTAIGDVVNTASRLESLTKDFNVEFIVSSKTATLSGLDISSYKAHKTNIRGRVEPLNILSIKSVSTTALA